MAIRDHLLLPNHYRAWFTIQHFIPHSFFDRIGLAEPFFGSQISWNYHYVFQNVWMVFREHKLTFRRILWWFTLELASCLCYRLAKINFWFGNFTKSVILYLIQKVYFCEPKKHVCYPNEEEKSKQTTSMEKYLKYMYCIAFTIISQTYFPCRDYL